MWWCNPSGSWFTVLGSKVIIPVKEFQPETVSATLNERNT